MTNNLSIADVLREGFEATKKNANSVLVLFVGLYALVFLLTYLLSMPFLNILMIPVLVLTQIAVFKSFKTPISKLDVNKIIDSGDPNFKQKLLWLTLYMIGWGLAIGILFLLLIIPGVIFMVYWYLSSFVFLDQGTSFTSSLTKSKEMIKGNWWRTFALVLIMAIVSAVLQGVVSGIGGGNTLIAGLLVSVVSGLTSVYFGYVGVAYYFNLKR